MPNRLRAPRVLEVASLLLIGLLIPAHSAAEPSGTCDNRARACTFPEIAGCMNAEAGASAEDQLILVQKKMRQSSVSGAAVATDTTGENEKIPSSTASEDSLPAFQRRLQKALTAGGPGQMIAFDALPDQVDWAVEGQETYQYMEHYDKRRKEYRGGHFEAYLTGSKVRTDASTDWIHGSEDPDALGDECSDKLRSIDTNGEPLALGAKTDHLVIVLNFVQAGFYGHLIDNGFPRLAYVAEPARKAGAKLWLAIPQDKVVYDWDSLRQSREIAQKVFGATLVVIGEPQSPQLPSEGVIRFFSTCALPAEHIDPRREMYRLFKQATAKVQCAAYRPKYKPIAYLSRVGGDARNGRGEGGFEPAMETLMTHTGKVETITNLASLSLDDVICTLRDRRAIIGVHGSNMFNFLWSSRPKRTVVEVWDQLDKSTRPPGQLLWAHDTGARYVLVPYSSGATNVPDKLEVALQQVMDQIKQEDSVVVSPP